MSKLINWTYSVGGNASGKVDTGRDVAERIIYDKAQKHLYHIGYSELTMQSWIMMLSQAYGKPYYGKTAFMIQEKLGLLFIEARLGRNQFHWMICLKLNPVCLKQERKALRYTTKSVGTETWSMRPRQSMFTKPMIIIHMWQQRFRSS